MIKFPRPLQAVLAATALLLPALASAQPAISTVEAVNYSALLPLLPEAPEGWTAEEAEGSTDDSGGFKLSTAHRDYQKGEGENIPLTSISILDSAGNQEYVAASTAAWDTDRGNAGRLHQGPQDRGLSGLRDLRERGQAWDTLGHGGQSLPPPDRDPGTGSGGTPGVVETNRSESPRGPAVISAS